MFGRFLNAPRSRNRVLHRGTQILLWCVFASVFVAVPNAYAGGISLQVNSWQRNVDTGAVSYSVTMNWTGAAATGGPCVGYCRWKVEAFYKDVTTTEDQLVISSGTTGGVGLGTRTKTYTGTSNKEITHLQATLSPYQEGEGETYTSPWYQVSSAYPDGQAQIKLNTWSVDPSTGTITYNVSMPYVGAGQYKGPCEEYCKWTIEGLYGQGQSSTLGSGSIFGAPSWQNTYSASGSKTLPFTHVRATLYPYSPTSPNETYVSTLPVPASLAEGIDLTVTDWTNDVESGEVDYDVDVAIKLPAGDTGCNTPCTWKVEGYYDDGTVEEFQSVLRSGTVTGPVVLYGTRLTGSRQFPGEITELRASVTPAGATEPRYTDVVQVSEPYPEGKVELTIGKWVIDPTSGDAAYDFSVNVSGSGQVNGPCYGACYLSVEALHRDGTIDTIVHSFVSGLPLSSSWTHTQDFTGIISSVGVTHLSARLVSADSGTEPYMSTKSVSDYVYKDQDLAAAGVALGPVLTRNPTFFCTRFLVQAGTHHLQSSLTDQYIACEAAVAATEYTIFKVLEGIFDAPGPDGPGLHAGAFPRSGSLRRTGGTAGLGG
jgi:hypothetical protein